MGDHQAAGKQAQRRLVREQRPLTSPVGSSITATDTDGGGVPDIVKVEFSKPRFSCPEAA